MISLDKGAKISLDKGMTKAIVRLNWKPQTRVGEDFDLDAYAIVIPEVGLPRDSDLVFHHNPKHPSECIIHSGDDKTGAQGEDITVDFIKIPKGTKKIVFAIDIYKAETRKQKFGMVDDSIATVINADTNSSEVRCDLGEDFSSETCVVACEIYMNNGEWKIKNVAAGYAKGLVELLRDYGFEVEDRKEV